MEGAKSITGILRGCGRRKPGGLYVCSGLSTFGRPLNEFVVDPALPFEGEPFRAPMVIERDGKKHLVLWVGSEYYPYPSDFIEETRNYGLSKRIPNKFQIEALEQGSMLFLVHQKAIVEDFGLLPAPEYCPSEKFDHKENDFTECCLGHSYNIAEPNEGLNKRKLGDTVYAVYPQGMTESTYDFKAGIFLRLPITHFDHIKTADGKVDPKIAGKKTKIPINIEKD